MGMQVILATKTTLQAHLDLSWPLTGLPASVRRWLVLLKGVISTRKSLGVS